MMTCKFLKDRSIEATDLTHWHICESSCQSSALSLSPGLNLKIYITERSGLCLWSKALALQKVPTCRCCSGSWRRRALLIYPMRLVNRGFLSQVGCKVEPIWGPTLKSVRIPATPSFQSSPFRKSVKIPLAVHTS